MFTAVFQYLSFPIYFDCSSLLIVYEGANPAIRRRLVSRHNSMNTSVAAASEDTERIDDDEEDIQMFSDAELVSDDDEDHVHGRGSSKRRNPKFGSGPHCIREAVPARVRITFKGIGQIIKFVDFIVVGQLIHRSTRAKISCTTIPKLPNIRINQALHI